LSDRERSRAHLLDLLVQPGVVEVLMALHHHDGAATLAQLHAAGVAHPAPALRSLAAAGQVCRADGGTWDTEPTQDTPYALTAAGRGLVVLC
jgi:hypothetical protein